MKAFLTLAISFATIGLSACVTEQQPEKAAEPVVEQTTGVPDWQSTLIDDLQTVEGKGDVFLDGAFKLYDQLLSEEPLTAERKTAIDDAVKTSAGRYAELVQAITNLKGDLARKDIKASLPLAGDTGETEYSSVNELFAFYRTSNAAPGAYDPNGGDSITKVLFEGAQAGDQVGLDSLPKQQRDALMLLDYLRLISNDLTYVSNTVSDWIDLEGKDLEAFAH